MHKDEAMAVEKYKAQLRGQEQTWEARFQYVLHSDLAGVQIGIVALRTAILINAGATVALLAFAAQLWEKDKMLIAKILAAGGPFIWGLIASAVGAAIAYFYQSFLTARYQHDLAEISAENDKLRPMIWTPRFVNVTRILMVGFVLAGYVCFTWGAFLVSSVIQPAS